MSFWSDKSPSWGSESISYRLKELKEIHELLKVNGWQVSKVWGVIPQCAPNLWSQIQGNATKEEMVILLLENMTCHKHDDFDTMYTNMYSALHL